LRRAYPASFRKILFGINNRTSEKEILKYSEKESDYSNFKF